MRFAIVVFFAVLSNTARAELPEVLFTRHDGLSSAGKVVHDWSRRAALHGLGVVPAAIIAPRNTMAPMMPQ